jgi:hypothetical protein
LSEKNAVFGWRTIPTWKGGKMRPKLFQFILSAALFFFILPNQVLATQKLVVAFSEFPPYKIVENRIFITELSKPDLDFNNSIRSTWAFPENLLSKIKPKALAGI